MRGSYCGAVVLLSAGTTALAQPRTVNTAMVWGGAFGDHRIGTKSSLYWDWQPRRAEAGRAWQRASRRVRSSCLAVSSAHATVSRAAMVCNSGIATVATR